MDETYHVKLVQKQEGIYTIYVFQKDNSDYIMCTKLPNWGVYNIEKGDTGFLTISNVVAGERYFDRNTGTEQMYQYDQCYFKEFIKDSKEVKEIIL